MKGRTKRILNMALIFGTLAIVLLIGLNDNSLGDAWIAVRSMNPFWVTLAILCFLGYMMMDAVAIHFFLRRQGYHVPFLSVCFIAVVGQYYSNITPGASGGQPMQIYYLHKHDVPTAIATSAISVRFICFQVMLSVFATVFWIVYGGYINEHVGSYRWILIVGYVYNVVMVTGVVFLVLSKNLIKRIIAFGVGIGTRFHWIKRPEAVSNRLNQAVDVFHDSLISFKNRSGDFVVQMVIGAIQLQFLMSIIYCVYRGLGLHEEKYLHLVALNVMEFISAAYTPLPGASGAQEGVFSVYFGGVFPAGKAFAALLLWRFFTYYISLLLGGIVVVIRGVREGKSLRQVAHEGNQVIEGVEPEAIMEVGKQTNRDT